MRVNSMLWVALRLLLVSLGLFNLAGCSPLVTTDQPQHTGDELIASGRSLGQSFVARQDGLMGVQVTLAPGDNNQGQVSLHLRTDATAEADLASSTMPVASVRTAGVYRFDFPPIPDSQGQYFYALLVVQGDGNLAAGTADADSYPDGSLYLEHTPRDEQLLFSLVYEPALALFGLAGTAFRWGLMLALAVFLWVLPGWALLSWLWEDWSRLDWGEKLALSAGVSLAVYPLFLLWTDLVRLHLGAVYAWLPPIIGLLLIIGRQIYGLRGAFKRGLRGVLFALRHPADGRVRPSASNRAASLALLGLLLLTFGIRFWVVRDLDLPMWGDAQQHTIITQLLIDRQGLFSSWEPYAELRSLTYHFGFHTASALFHWVTGASAAKSVLWTGQLMNGMAILALYPLAKKAGNSPWAGVVAVLLAGLLVPLPLGYTNWGRFTQLAGQVILPGAVYLLWESFGREKSGWRLIGLVWLLLAGLATTHYRVLIMAIAFIPAYLLLEIRRDTQRGRWLRLLLRTLWTGLGAMLLAAPWLMRTYGGQLMRMTSAQLATPADAVTGFAQEYNAIGDLRYFLPAWVWLVLPVVIAWGFWQRRKGVALVSLWWFGLLLAANPTWLKLPGANIINNFTLFIAGYILAGLVIGALFGWLLEHLIQRLQQSPDRKIFTRGAISLTVLLILLLGMGGMRFREADVNTSTHSLAARPDVRAAAWIRENTPQDASFLVNGFMAYGDSLVIGSDGGWWLPILAGRQVTIPPMTYGIEQGNQPGYLRHVNALYLAIREKGVTHPDVISMLHTRGIDYVYIGQKQGRVDFTYTGQPILQPEALAFDPHFRRVYQLDRVWIFEVLP